MTDSKIRVAELRRLLEAAHCAGDPPWSLPYNAERLEYLVALRNAAPALLRVVEAAHGCVERNDNLTGLCDALHAFDFGENDG